MRSASSSMRSACCSCSGCCSSCSMRPPYPGAATRTLTASPPGSTASVHPCGRLAERPGTRRATRPDHSVRAPCAISIRGRDAKPLERSAKRPRGGGPAPGTTTLGAIHRSGGSHSIGMRASGQRLPVRDERGGARRGVPPAERGNVGGLGSVKQVAGREDPRPGGAQRGVHGRAARARVHVEPRHHGELVVRNPVGREDDGVALHVPHRTAVEVRELHLLHARAAVDRGRSRCASRAESESEARHRRGTARATGGAAAR